MAREEDIQSIHETLRQFEDRFERLDRRVDQFYAEFREMHGELKPVVVFFKDNGHSLKARISEIENARARDHEDQRSRWAGWIGQIISGLIAGAVAVLGTWMMLGGN